MNKFRLFISNFVIYGLGGIISKIIPLIMVPIVTRIMPDASYFGISDLSNTVIQFGCALAIMGMYDAMYRMFFEKDEEDYKKAVCSTALVFTLFTSCVIFVLMLLGRDLIARYFFSDPQYTNVVYLSAIATLVGATNSIISAPTRMQNEADGDFREISCCFGRRGCISNSVASDILHQFSRRNHWRGCRNLEFNRAL